MSQARITLRPPPNVEFVQGYPGIPPVAHERPQAEVKGTIELRLGAQGIKAKWVRVELRKVEILPGGGQANTFYDFVGQSPVKVWEAPEGEWSVLQTQDFGFSIRIPESIPPSIALDKSAGIKYELIATLCMKGKKGFFRRASTPTLSHMAPIVIDKHELHSTWPVYAQPETRRVADELLSLTVDRAHTCFGPGDRVNVTATFRNEGVTVAVLRAFEFILKETIIYRAGPHASGKKGAPQVNATLIGEQKVPVNATIYGGQQHRAELGCFIPQTHTTTTVNAARHIDITYTINIKAVLSSGKPLLMDLPITVSNWPKNMSIEAVRRIGPSPNLSLIASNQVHLTQTSAPQDNSGLNRSNVLQSANPSLALQQISGFGTAPSRLEPIQVRSHQTSDRLVQHTGQGMHQLANLAGSANNARGLYDEFGYPASAGASSSVTQPATYGGYSSAVVADERLTDARRRPPINTSPTKRLTITNANIDVEPDLLPTKSSTSFPKKFMTAAEEKKQLQNNLGDTPGGSGSSSIADRPRVAATVTPARSDSLRKVTDWPTAEQEKQRLYESARQRAQKTQASMGNYVSSMPARSSSAVAQPARKLSLEPLQTTPPTSAPTTERSGWPTAEEEKLRLYTEAQNTARRTQSQVQVVEMEPSSSSMSAPSKSQVLNKKTSANTVNMTYGGDSSQPSINASRPMESKSTGALLYQHAMESLSRSTSAQVTLPGPANTSPPAQRQKEALTPSHDRFPTADEEKAALRYYEAKRAVDRRQNMAGYKQTSLSSIPSEQPIAYDTLYPAGPSGLTGPAQLNDNSQSSPNVAPLRSGNSSSGVLEYRTAELYNNDSSFLPSDTPSEIPSPSPPPLAVPQFQSALAEKERLRQKYASEDFAGAESPSNGEPLLVRDVPMPSRSQPLPPVDLNSPRRMTAAEEKARLRAQYEAEEAQAAESANDRAATSPPARVGQPQPTGSASTSDNDSTFHISSNPSNITRSLSLQRSNEAPNTPASVADYHHELDEFHPPPPPPPLAPRPPAEYIQETKEEDARTQAEDHMYSRVQAKVSDLHSESRLDFGLSFRPFSPFDLSVNFDTLDKAKRASPTHTQVMPPPLPPKVPISE